MKRLLLLLPLLVSFAYVMNAQSIPNPDFENWSTAINYMQPDTGWFTSNPNCIAALDTVNVTKIAGGSGNAVLLHTISKTIAPGVVDTQVAYISNTPFMPFTLKGGMPYSSTSLLPEYLNVNFEANVATFDTAIILVIFKYASALPTYNEFKITGSAFASAWKDSSFQLAISQVPDSFIIAVTSSNVILNDYINPNSWIAIDNMYFITTGSPEAIGGGSFDSSSTQSILLPTGWAEKGRGFAFEGVTQSSTAEHGSYAIQLVTEASGGNGGTNPAPMSCTSGYFTQDNGSAGGVAYTYTGADTLYGYYEYNPTGIDSGFVVVTLDQASNIPVPGFPQVFALTSASSYTPFKVGWGTPAQPPATMRIDFISSSQYTPGAGSTLTVDNLSLKSQSTSAVNNVNQASKNMIVYPNPANDVLNIMFGQAPSNSVNVKIYDLSGKEISETEYTSSSVIHVPVAQLPTGMYFYEVSADGSVSHNKFVKQ